MLPLPPELHQVLLFLLLLFLLPPACVGSRESLGSRGWYPGAPLHNLQARIPLALTGVLMPRGMCAEEAASDRDIAQHLFWEDTSVRPFPVTTLLLPKNPAKTTLQIPTVAWPKPAGVL